MQLVLLKLFNFLQFFPAGYPYLSTYSASKHALHVRIRLVTLFTFFIDMLAPKSTQALYVNFHVFSSRDLRSYQPWVLNLVFICHAVIQIALIRVHVPRGLLRISFFQ